MLRQKVKWIESGGKKIAHVPYRIWRDVPISQKKAFELGCQRSGIILEIGKKQIPRDTIHQSKENWAQASADYHAWQEREKTRQAVRMAKNAHNY